MDNPSDIPEAVPVPPTHYPQQQSTPPPPKGNTCKGFLWGCLFSALLLLLIFILCFGSCVAIGLSAMKTANLDQKPTDAESPKPSLTLVRSGADDTFKIAAVSIHGAISNTNGAGGFFAEEAGSSSSRVCRELRAIRLDGEYIGVILDMNTPGGEVVASDEIRSEVDKLRMAGKPVVTCMHTLGASGGYYIASGSDWIVANRLTMTGSVGVIIQSFEASRLMTMIGVKPLTYRSGNFKDMLSPMRPVTPEEDEYINAMVKQDFHEFCQVIANGRPEYFPTVDDVLNAPFADGRVVSGADALEMHLIDQLGDFDDAVAKVRELANGVKAPVYAYSLRRDWKSFLMSMASPRQPVEVKTLEHIIPGATLQPGVRYYLLPQAVK